MKSSNITITTTVSNFTLYKKTIKTFPEVNNIYIVDGTKGLFGIHSITFLLKKLRHKGIKWLVFCDEDVVFINQNEVFDLIEHLEKEQYDVCGIRDGGMLSWRDKNPYLLNPFFLVLNLEKVYKFYKEEEVLSQPPIKENEFSDDLSDLEYKYDIKSNFESYYCFFLWMRRKQFKIKFLLAKSNLLPNDLETTAVYNHNNKLILYHTWYARVYGRDNYHTKRIDEVIEKGKTIKPYKERKIKILRNYKFVINKLLNKLVRKLNYKKG